MFTHRFPKSATMPPFDIAVRVLFNLLFFSSHFPRIFKTSRHTRGYSVVLNVSGPKISWAFLCVHATLKMVLLQHVRAHTKHTHAHVYTAREKWKNYGTDFGVCTRTRSYAYLHVYETYSYKHNVLYLRGPTPRV